MLQGWAGERSLLEWWSPGLASVATQWQPASHPGPQASAAIDLDPLKLEPPRELSPPFAPHPHTPFPEPSQTGSGNIIFLPDIRLCIVFYVLSSGNLYVIVFTCTVFFRDLFMFQKVFPGMISGVLRVCIFKPGVIILPLG